MNNKFYHRQKDGQNLTLSDDRFQGGSIEHPSLRIKEITRNDMGTYTCILRNIVGISSSVSGIKLSVTCKCIPENHIKGFLKHCLL